MSIYRSAVEHPVTTALIFIALAILGVFSLSKTSIALLPEVDSNTIMVMASYQGANAQEIETNLTKVLENALNGVEDLKELTSQSKENISLLTLTFNYGVDIEAATNSVRDKLDMVNSMLPDGVSNPVIFKFSASDMPITPIWLKQKPPWMACFSPKPASSRPTTLLKGLKSSSTIVTTRICHQ